MPLLLRGGTVVSDSALLRADVLVDGEKIVAVGRDLESSSADVVDAAGLHLLPGGVDVHTHLDMPLGDIRSSDDFHTGHVAAAFGGTTTHLDFANQSKGGTLREAVETWHGMARGKACIDYGFHVTVTDVNDHTLSEISELPAMGITTIKMLMAYKGRIMVEDADLFRAMRCARDAGILTMLHCENGDVIDLLVREAVERGWTQPAAHPATRPVQLEGEATGRAIAIAEILGAPIYIVHVTCAEALTRIGEAQRREQAHVHAETCVQYLVFTTDDLDREGFEGAKWVCSPPFRGPDDIEALWRALRDGTLSVVSTDHCPFYFETQKVLGVNDFSKIPNGVPGIEDRLTVLNELGVRAGRLDLCRFVGLTATNPANIFGLGDRKGRIAPGLDADIALWDMSAARRLSIDNYHSAVDYRLYEGMDVRGVPVKVYRRGELIVDGDDFLAEEGSGRFLFRSITPVSGRAG
ncbi:MAG TPA: dihydropyrimidinase [Chloroflexi bacterium]|nr:dihydropyrimidinase [Chloroflexota bacterium]